MVSKSSTDIQIKDLDTWKRGQISYFSRSRMQEDALKAAINVIYDYDGVVRPRGSFTESGIPDIPIIGDITPQPLGQDFTFKRANNSEGLINVFTEGDEARIYVLNEDMLGWTRFDTVMDATARVSFDQIAGVVVIGNGVDKFTYYDIAAHDVKQFEHVDDPTLAPVLTPNGFSGTAAFDYYYRVALNGVGGSTKMSPAQKISSSTLRDTWGGDRSVNVNISALTLDPDAKSWNVYVAMVTTGTGAPGEDEYLLIGENIPVTQKQHQDTGELTYLQKAPVENSTEGVRAWYFKNISGRLWAIGTDGSTVYWGGDLGNELYFGSANGSDSYAINPDSTETPMAITLGRDNGGTTCINLLTRRIAGLGSIWDVYATSSNITASGQSLTVSTYQFKQREGNDGTDAPFSVLHENNNTYYLSMDGFKSTGVKPNITGIQSTDIISSAIRDRILNLNEDSLHSVYAAYYDESLYWTVSYGSSRNDEIWVYDMLHGGIWSIWRIQADCIFRWASEKNESPSLYIRQGNKLLRYYKNLRTHSDLGVPFTSYIESGLIPFAKNRLEWVHLLKTIWQFDQSTGVINVTLNVHSKNGDIIKAVPVPLGGSNSGVTGAAGWDAVRLDGAGSLEGAWASRLWDEVLSTLSSNIVSSDRKVDQKVRKNTSYISFKIEAKTVNTYYELSHIGLLFTYIGPGIEFLSQRGVIKI